MLSLILIDFDTQFDVFLLFQFSLLFFDELLLQIDFFAALIDDYFHAHHRLYITFYLLLELLQGLRSQVARYCMCVIRNENALIFVNALEIANSRAQVVEGLLELWFLNLGNWRPRELSIKRDRVYFCFGLISALFLVGIENRGWQKQVHASFRNEVAHLGVFFFDLIHFLFSKLIIFII